MFTKFYITYGLCDNLSCSNIKRSTKKKIKITVAILKSVTNDKAVAYQLKGCYQFDLRILAPDWQSDY